jgi:hypothetical protein
MTRLDATTKLESSDGIFYPTVAESSEQLSEEDALHDLFLRQIFDSAKAEKNVVEHSGPRFNQAGLKLIESKTKEMVELPIRLTEDIPVEFVYKKRVTVGNFVSRKEGSSAVQVRLVTGDIATIDVGQIISVWDMLADEVIPTTVADWAQVTAEAIEILGDMSPRKSDLQQFWEIVSNQRSAAIPIDSLDLGVYIFQERSFKRWVNPYTDASSAGVQALSSSQRYAAALLLFSDDFHFKRRQTVFTDAPLADESNNGDESGNSYSVDDLLEDGSIRDDDDSEGVYVIEGAYRALDAGTCLFREGEVFAKYFEERISNKGDSNVPFRAGCITRQLRALEVYALSPSNMSPPSAVKHILKRLQKPLTPDGARAVLREISYESGGDSLAATAAGIRKRRLLGRLTGASATQAAAVDGKANSASSTASSIVTPWPPAVLADSAALSKEADERRKELREEPRGKVGKKSSSGRMDYRDSEHPVLCVDNAKTSFFDDAFSLSPETGEILVHVADVAGTLRKYDLLQQTAKERISSTFLPSGPLHMLPPQALDALKLSTAGPNEVITVALSVDATSGEVLGFRLFPSVIGPVFNLDVNTADELIAGVGVQNGETPSEVSSDRAGIPDAVVRDLLTAHKLMRRVIERQPWVDAHFSAGTFRSFKLDKRTDTYEQSNLEKTPANRMVNAMLTLYANSSCMFCEANGVDLPIAWENRDRIESARIRRFATQPLRNWLSQLQQKQLRAAMKMELPLSRKDCAMAVTHHNSKRKQTSALVGRGRDVMSFESFETHCARLLKTKSGEGAVFLAEGTGKGGIVRIKDFQVTGVVGKTVERGERVRVSVRKIVPETKSVLLDIIE